MAIGLENGVYDTSKITPPPAPNYSTTATALSTYSDASPLSGTTVSIDTVILDTAGTWDGQQVVGVCWETPTTYHELSTIALDDGLLGGTDTDLQLRLPGGHLFYLVTTENYGIPFTVVNSSALQTPLSGQNIVVGPNRRRKYHLGYI